MIQIDLDTKDARQMLQEYEKLVRVVDFPNIVLKTSTKVAQAGAKACKPVPGEKSRLRELIPAANKDRATRKKGELSERTDTARKATHWIKFYRQNKAPFFVPVTKNPFAKSTHQQQWDSHRRKRRKKGTHVAFLPNQQTRGDHTGFNDKPKDIQQMRRIGRRGLAANSFAFLQSKASKTYKVEKRDDAVKKWSQFTDQTKDKFNPSATVHSKLTYLKKRYPGVESRIGRDALRFFRGEITARLDRRAKQAMRA